MHIIGLNKLGTIFHLHFLKKIKNTICYRNVFLDYNMFENTFLVLLGSLGWMGGDDFGKKKNVNGVFF